MLEEQNMLLFHQDGIVFFLDVESCMLMLCNLPCTILVCFTRNNEIYNIENVLCTWIYSFYVVVVMVQCFYIC